MQAVADGRYGLVSSTHASGKVSSTPIMFVKSISEQLTGEQKATASKEMQLEALALRKLNSEYVMSAIGIVPEGDTMQPHHLLLTMYKHGNMRDFLQAIALSDSFSDATLPGAFRVSLSAKWAFLLPHQVALVRWKNLQVLDHNLSCAYNAWNY